MGDAKDPEPRVVVLAGPNGAGKSTSASRLLRGVLGVDEFVNADIIAQGLSGFAPDRVAMAAGRIMMRRLRELAALRASFAFETTLASRTFAPWLADLRSQGYAVQIVFLWLPSEEMAVQRVSERVRLGGHDVPAATVRRRYRAGVRNFFNMYQPLVDSWQIVDNSVVGTPRLVATGVGKNVDVVEYIGAWEQLRHQITEANDGRHTK
jgi:predicted ABC-type ATPase